MVKIGSPKLLSVMTVDDSPLVAERVNNLLKDLENIELLGNAKNIAEALELVQLKIPDVTILDIQLVDYLIHTNGIHLLVILKRKYPQMKVIMLTNLAGVQYRKECLAKGADYFLDKSNDFERLPETLRKLQF